MSAAVRKVPMRQCTGCQEMKNKKEMIRVLKTSEGEILLDATGKKNGRGAYLCMNPACLAKARKTGRLHSALDAEISEEVYDALARELAKCTPPDDDPAPEP